MLDIMYKGFEKVVHVLLAIMVTAMVTLVIANVFFRYVIKSSLAWSDEASRYLLVFVAFLTLVELYQEHGHVYITNFIEAKRLPAKAKKILTLIKSLCEMIFFGILIYGGLTLIPMSLMITTPALNIPMGYLYVIVPLTGFFMIIFCVRDIIVQLKGWVEK